jgi:hypothetical protein
VWLHGYRQESEGRRAGMSKYSDSRISRQPRLLIIPVLGNGAASDR